MRPIPETERIETLDVLRGIALAGMIYVHFQEAFTHRTPLGQALGTMNQWFFANRFMSMFAMLFGAGFAVQLSRAEARGDQFFWRYVRRLAALAVFGVISTQLFGFQILLTYAIWGFPLLLVRSWSNRAVFVTLIVCLMAQPIYWSGRAAYDVATGGVEKFRADAGFCRAAGLTVVWLPEVNASPLCQERRRDAERQTAAPASDYLSVVRNRFVRLWDRWMQTVPVVFLPGVPFVLFLAGMLLFRMKVFQEPAEHRRLIVRLMIFGAASTIGFWFLYPYMRSMSPDSAPLALQVVLGFIAMPLSRGEGLALVYMGVILLLIASSPVWLRRLRAFGITGRMALTNYMLQSMIIDLVVQGRYGLHLRIPSQYALLATLVLFSFQLVVSAWWLSRYRYGPLEWIWRSVTYWEVPSLRLNGCTGSR